VDGALVVAFFKTGKANNSQVKSGNVLITTTVRDFAGGLNVTDTDLNMKPKYAKILDNMERALDGTLSIRHGTRLLATVNASADTSAIVNCYYFNNYVITVQASGRICQVNGAGVVTSLSVLWGATTFVSFTVFNSQLLIHNGTNKPQRIEGNPNKANYMTCIYSIDPGSGTNVNTPIGSLVISHAQYTIVAGIAAAPSTLYITARGTSGTFLGDPAPNDAVALDLGPRVSLGSSAITGMVSYRDKLMVTFERGVLPINLGIYTGSPTAVHTPTDDGFIEEFGCLAHRSLISVGDDTFFNDNIGVNSIERIVLYNTLRPNRVSQLIDPLITALIQPLSPAQIAQYVFAVYDMRNKRYMLFVPVFVGGMLTETIGFSYTDIPALKISAWARLRGWTWSCGCRTTLQNVIFANSNKLYTYDFDNAITNADFIGDTAYAADGTGIPITFDWELPWADFNKRMNVKETAYLAMDTTGSASFIMSMYVDNIRTDSQGVDAPLLSTDFVGGNFGGWGAANYGHAPYGGGRPTADERLFAWPAQFKISKLRAQGSSKLPLKFISVSLAYKRGSVRGM
jgi:hypothetical protein